MLPIERNSKETPKTLDSLSTQEQIVLLSMLLFETERLSHWDPESDKEPVFSFNPVFADLDDMMFPKIKNVEGTIAEFVADSVKKNPRRNIFKDLTDTDIDELTLGLSAMFENQEWCAMCEAWSHYEIDPNDFARVVGVSMLSLVKKLPMTDINEAIRSKIPTIELDNLALTLEKKLGIDKFRFLP